MASRKMIQTILIRKAADDMDFSKISWQTTGLGILTVVAALINLILVPSFDADPLTVANWGEFTSFSLVALGLARARDTNK